MTGTRGAGEGTINKVLRKVLRVLADGGLIRIVSSWGTFRT